MAMRLGVLLPALRQPTVLAHALATLDQLAQLEQFIHHVAPALMS
jgi:hypothetical protein